MKQRHEVNCSKCGEKFDNKVDFLAHKEEFHEFKCSIDTCKQMFDDTQKLEKHLKDSHKIKCPHCPMNLETKGLLGQHIRALHGHKCPDCPRTFQHLKLMMDHLRAEHQSCDVCEDEFSWPEEDHECYYTKNNVRPTKYY